MRISTNALTMYQCIAGASPTPLLAEGGDLISFYHRACPRFIGGFDQYLLIIGAFDHSISSRGETFDFILVKSLPFAHRAVPGAALVSWASPFG